jgi:hypothetical protein
MNTRMVFHACGTDDLLITRPPSQGQVPTKGFASRVRDFLISSRPKLWPGSKSPNQTGHRSHSRAGASQLRCLTFRSTTSKTSRLRSRMKSRRRCAPPIQSPSGKKSIPSLAKLAIFFPCSEITAPWRVWWCLSTKISAHRTGCPCSSRRREDLCVPLFLPNGGPLAQSGIYFCAPALWSRTCSISEGHAGALPCPSRASRISRRLRAVVSGSHLSRMRANASGSTLSA